MNSNLPTKNVLNTFEEEEIEQDDIDKEHTTYILTHKKQRL